MPFAGGGTDPAKNLLFLCGACLLQLLQLLRRELYQFRKTLLTALKMLIGRDLKEAAGLKMCISHAGLLSHGSRFFALRFLLCGLGRGFLLRLFFLRLRYVQRLRRDSGGILIAQASSRASTACLSGSALSGGATS